MIAPLVFSLLAAVAAPKHGSTYLVGMSQCNLGEPWRVQMNADIRRAAARHPELTVEYKDAQNDSLRQRQEIEEFVEENVDLLIVSPKEAAPLTPPVAAAYAKGIPVIVLDRRVLGDAYTEFIGANNRSIGRAAGEWIAERLERSGKSKIVELEGLMTSTPAQERHAGFREGIAHRKVEVVRAADMKWLEPQARLEMESALGSMPEIDLVFAHNDPGAHGAYLAAQAAGRADGLLIVGIDGLPQEGRMFVRQGWLSATFEYPTGGAQAIENGLKILHGETVPKEVELPSRIFTPENIARGGDPLPAGPKG